MNDGFTLVLTWLLVLSLVACKDQGYIDPEDCVFEQNDENRDGVLDENELSIMDDCRNNELGSVSEIESNLIGEWVLIGHGEGWVPTISQPCSNIIITEDNLEWSISDGWKDTTIITTWEIIELNPPLGSAHRLVVGSDFSYGLDMVRFCERYMFGNEFVFDGNIYIYEKVK